MSEMTLTRNKPCELGKAAGANLARFADEAEKEWRDAGMSFIPQRCASCAFRAETFPNGCLSTVADAMKCTMEREPFYCHHGLENGEPQSLCAGWLLLHGGGDPVVMPWDYSGDHGGPAARVPA